MTEGGRTRKIKKTQQEAGFTVDPADFRKQLLDGQIAAGEPYEQTKLPLLHF